MHPLYFAAVNITESDWTREMNLMLHQNYRMQYYECLLYRVHHSAGNVDEMLSTVASGIYILPRRK